MLVSSFFSRYRFPAIEVDFEWILYQAELVLRILEEIQ